jgi:very-short-patch-repair endonuclease
MQAIGLSCYGFSRLSFFDKQLFKVIGEEVIYRATVGINARSLRYTLADIGMIGKAFGNSCSNEEGVTYALMQLARGKTGHKNFNLTPNPESVLCLISALTRIDRTHSKGIEKWISQNLFAVIDKLSSSQIVQILACLRKINIKNTPLYIALVDAIDLRLIGTESIPQTLSQLSHFSSIVGKEKIDIACKIFSVHLPRYQLDQLVHFLHALSEFAYRKEDVLGRIGQALVHQLDAVHWDQTILTKLVTASSRLRLTDIRLHNAIWAAVYANLPNITSERCICNILFAIAATVGAGDGYNDWIPSILKSLLSKLVDVRLSAEGIRQSQIVNLWIQMPENGLRTPVMLDERVQEFLRKLATINTYASNHLTIEQSSISHREISKYFVKLGLVHRNEVILGPFTLDIYVPETRTVIEVDGPHHFFRDSVLRTSSSVLKHRILTSLGYRVEHVPFHEWLQCNNDTKKLAYCNSLADRARTPN